MILTSSTATFRIESENHSVWSSKISLRETCCSNDFSPPTQKQKQCFARQFDCVSLRIEQRRILEI